MATGNTASEDAYALTPEQISHFMEHGWLKVENCFSREQAAEATSTLWTRLGMDENDMGTWTTERTNMPHHKFFPLTTFAPKALSTISQLCGGVSRIGAQGLSWGDSFIVNLGTPEGHNKPTRPQDLKGWHVDGDFFIHFLDSQEQGLLVIPLWTDIAPSAGGTYICPPAIPLIAKHLYEHPEGVSPRMTPRAEDPTFDEALDRKRHAVKGGIDGLAWFNSIAASMPDSAFVEATGKIGDVYFLHPLMLHTASNNALRIPRVITNPPVSLKEPFCFDREDESEFSLVERKTLKALGKENLKGWRITGERGPVIPLRVKNMERMKREEKERLEKLKEKSGVEQRVEQVGTVA